MKCLPSFLQKKNRSVKPFRFFAAIVFLFATIVEHMFADENDILPITFEKQMTRYELSTLPTQDRWSYCVTLPRSVNEFERDPKIIRNYITLEQGDDHACRLRSKKNFVALFRLVDPTFKNASRLSWRWSVSKHPFNGTAVGRPNDQSIQVFVVFHNPELPSESEQYTILSFVWTAKTTGKQFATEYRLPSPNSPRVPVRVQVLQDGSIDGLISQEVELQTEYRKAFGKAAPPVWGILLFADSDESKEVVPGEMITDAIIRDIRFSR